MSYSLGDTRGWDRWYAQPTEVYVWRADVGNANIQTPEDARLFLRAVAKAQKLSLDARAITVLQAADDPTRSRIDVVLTADSFIPYAVPSTAKVVAERARVDGPLTARFPNVQFLGQSFLQLVAPPDAIDFWKAHPVIWDDQTGPLQAFAELKGIYKGRIDDGPNRIGSLTEVKYWSKLYCTELWQIGKTVGRGNCKSLTIKTPF